MNRSFPSGSDSKESACKVGDMGSIPRSGRSPGEGNGNSLQDSCLENPIDRGAWQATVHSVAQSQIRLERLNTRALNCKDEGSLFVTGIPLSQFWHFLVPPA